MQYSTRGPRGGPFSAALLCALALTGCERDHALAPDVTPAPPMAAPAAPVAHVPVAALPSRELGEPLGAFRFTMYYVAHEESFPRVDGGVGAAVLSGGADKMSGVPDEVHVDEGDGGDAGLIDDDDEAHGVDHGALAATRPRAVASSTIYGRGCKPLARVSKGFAKQLAIQGTGKLRDGRVINTAGAGRCDCAPCYEEVAHAWGMGSNGRLMPFRTVAIDTSVIKRGSMLYLPELEGVRMPGRPPWGGYVHDGCVLADDVGGGIEGFELDFFVAKKTYSTALDVRHRIKRVTVFDGKGWCERKGGSVRKAAAI